MEGRVCCRDPKAWRCEESTQKGTVAACIVTLSLRDNLAFLCPQCFSTTSSVPCEGVRAVPRWLLPMIETPSWRAKLSRTEPPRPPSWIPGPAARQKHPEKMSERPRRLIPTHGEGSCTRFQPWSLASSYPRRTKPSSWRRMEGLGVR